MISSPCKEEYTKLLSSPKASTSPYLGSGDDNSLLLKTPRLDMTRSNSFTITPSRPSSSTSNIMSLVDVDGRQQQQGSNPPHHHHRRDDSHVSFNTSPTSLHLLGGNDDSLILKTPRQSPTSLHHHHRHDSRGSTLFNTSPLSLLHRRDDSRTTFNTSPTSLNLNLTDMYSSIDIDNFFDDLVANSEMSPIASKPTTGSSDQGIVGSNTRQIQYQQQAMHSNTASSSTLYHHHARSNSLQMIKNDHTFLSGGLTSPLVDFEVDCPHQYGNYHHPTNTPPIQPFHVDYPSLTISSTTTAAVEVASNCAGGVGDSSCTPNNRRSTKKVKRSDDRLTSSDPLPRGSKTTKKTATSRKRSLPMPLLELKSSSSFPPAFPQGSITPSQGTLEMYDNELYRKLRDAPFQPSIISSSSTNNHLPRPLVPPDVTGNRLIVLHGPSESRDDHEIEDCVASKTYAFYKYLREIYPALDGCTYLLPGLQQHGGGRSSRNTNEECGNTNNNVLNNNLDRSGTMNISKVGSFVLGHTPGMSKSEKVCVKRIYML
jgi:hypothetical protein